VNAEQAISRLREVVRRQHKAISTESTYVFWLRRYMLAIPRHPEELTSEQKLERFLTEWARDRGISAVSQNQAFNAILFFYRDVLGHPLQDVDALRATRPVRMRSAPSVEHTQALLKMIRNIGGYPTNLVGATRGIGQEVSGVPVQLDVGMALSSARHLQASANGLPGSVSNARGQRPTRSEIRPPAAGHLCPPARTAHGYATHCLERGANPRAIQQAMGHACLETTMGYLHAESLSVRSPLDILEAGRAPMNFGLNAPDQPDPLIAPTLTRAVRNA
jgi:hypothetical protein